MATTALLPHARLLHRRRGRDAGGAAAGLAWSGWVRGPGTAAALAVPDHHHDLPQDDQSAGREPATTDDVAWLQPYPDVLLDQLVDADADPAAVIDRRASVTLAFVAAMQLLPATQRAVLILRDVLCWSSREVAELLDTTVAAVNSALQRARATLAATPGTSAATIPLGDQERRVVDAFVRAWADCDMAALAALLREDAILTMPPQSIRIVGRDRDHRILRHRAGRRPTRPHPPCRHPRQRPPGPGGLPAR